MTDLQEFLNKHGWAHKCPWGCNRVITDCDTHFNAFDHFLLDTNKKKFKRHLIRL